MLLQGTTPKLCSPAASPAVALSVSDPRSSSWIALTALATVDGRSLIAIGCEEGVWIGLRHDPRSLRKVLHVKAVTNIAVLEDFGIVLVLQEKVSPED